MVIVHCWSMASDPRRFLGAYSATEAVTIAESAPMASPISVRANSRTAASGVTVGMIAPVAWIRTGVHDFRLDVCWALAEHDHPAGKEQRLFHIVGHEQRGEASALPQ